MTPVRLLGPVGPSYNGPPPLYEPSRPPTPLLRPKSPQPVDKSPKIKNNIQDLNSSNDSIPSDHYSDIMDDLPPTLKAAQFGSPPGSTLTSDTSDPDSHENQHVHSNHSKSTRKNKHDNHLSTKWSSRSRNPSIMKASGPPPPRRDREYSAMSHRQHQKYQQKQQQQRNPYDNNNPVVTRMQSDGWFSNDHRQQSTNKRQHFQHRNSSQNHPATLRYSNSVDGRHMNYSPSKNDHSNSKKNHRFKVQPQASDMGPNRLAERAELYKRSGVRETGRRGYEQGPWERRVKSVDREYDTPRVKTERIIDDDNEDDVEAWGGYQKRKMLPLRKIVWTCRKAFHRARGNWEHNA